MSSSYSIGAMNQLADALEAAGYTPEDVTRLKQYKDLAGIKKVLLDLATITLIVSKEPVVAKHIIDCDADPFLPEGWKVEEHRKGGQLEWDSTKVRLHLSPNQQGGKIIGGNKLHKELANEPVLNANVLDYLLAHPELIPEEWKGKAVFFWGTIFRDSGGNLYVRYLCWYGGAWGWSDDWLDGGWSHNNPAALRAS